MLLSAFDQRDSEELSKLLRAYELFGIAAEHVPLIARLIREDWHLEHEALVELLQDLKAKDGQTIEALYAATQMRTPYLKRTGNEPLARRAIFALGKIDNQVANAKLKIIARSVNPILAEAALDQLFYDPWRRHYAGIKNQLSEGLRHTIEDLIGKDGYDRLIDYLLIDVGEDGEGNLEALEFYIRPFDVPRLLAAFLRNGTWEKGFRIDVAGILLRLKCFEGYNDYMELLDSEIALWRKYPCAIPDFAEMYQRAYPADMLASLAYINPNESIRRSSEFFAVGMHLSCNGYYSAAASTWVQRYADVDPKLLRELIFATRTADAKAGEMLQVALLVVCTEQLARFGEQTTFATERLREALAVCVDTRW